MNKPRAKKLSKNIHAAACSLAFGSMLMSATAQAQSDGVASIFLGQENGYDNEAGIFTNTINLVTNDENLIIAAPAGYQSVQKTVITSISFTEGDWAGMSNIFDASIIGDSNAVYFTQQGGSLLSLAINGADNTVTLAELGGDNTRFENANLKIWGVDNAITTSKAILALAKTLDIELGSALTTADGNAVLLSYDDFSEITGRIGNVADTANVTVDIKQNYSTGGSPSSEAENNSVNFVINNILTDLTSNFVIAQDGLNNKLLLEAVGDSYDVNIYQENDGTYLNQLDLTLGSDTTLDLDLYGPNDSFIELFGTSNTVKLDNYFSPYTERESKILIGGVEDPSSSDNNDVSLSDFGWVLVDITGDGNRIGDRDVPTTGNLNLQLDGDRNEVDIFNNRLVPVGLDDRSGVLLKIDGNDNKAWIRESGGYSDYNEYNITGNDNSLFVDISGFSGDTSDSIDVIMNGDINSLGVMIDLVGAAYFGNPVIAIEGSFNKIGMDNNTTYTSAPSSTTASFAELVGSPEANSKFAYNRYGSAASFINFNRLDIAVEGDGNMMQFSNGALTEGVATEYEGIFNINYWGHNNAFTYNLWGTGDFTHDVGNRVGSVYSSNWNGVISSNGSGGFDMNITQLGFGESILSSQGGKVVVSNITAMP